MASSFSSPTTPKISSPCPTASRFTYLSLLWLLTMWDSARKLAKPVFLKKGNVSQGWPRTESQPAKFLFLASCELSSCALNWLGVSVSSCRTVNNPGVVRQREGSVFPGVGRGEGGGPCNSGSILPRICGLQQVYAHQ